MCGPLTHLTSTQWTYTILYGAQLNETLTTPHARVSKDDPISRIKVVFANLSKEVVKKACARFRGRIEDVIDAKSGFVK